MPSCVCVLFDIRPSNLFQGCRREEEETRIVTWSTPPSACSLFFYSYWLSRDLRLSYRKIWVTLAFVLTSPFATNLRGNVCYGRLRKFDCLRLLEDLKSDSLKFTFFPKSLHLHWEIPLASFPGSLSSFLPEGEVLLGQKKMETLKLDQQINDHKAISPVAGSF